MAYLKSCDHDVFISYAHIDNEPDHEGEKGWVEQFAKQLGTRLIKRFGELVDIWCDPALKRAQLFDPVIEKAVHGSGIMVALITNRYLNSKYCQQEIKWFSEKAAQEPGGLIVENHVRIFPVLLYNIAPERWPEACHGTSGFMFHDASGADFGEPLDPGSEAFSRQLRGLVEELYAVLTRLKQHKAAPTLDKADAALASDFTIFMAASAEALGAIRRQVSQKLAQQGITVVGNIPPPYEEGPHAKAVIQAIQEADLCVHLMSTSPGEPLDLENPSKTFPVEQVRLGLEHAHSQLILAPDEFAMADIEDATFAAFIRELTEKPREADRLEIVRTGRHQMIDAILLKKQALEKAAREAEGLENRGLTAFIDLHIKDVANATELVSYLSQHKRMVPIMIPSADLTPSAGMLWFEENLKKAQLVIIVFGAVARTWVDYRLQEAFKLMLGHRLATPIGVYIAPPRKEPDDVKFPVEVMVNTDKFDAGTLAGLLHKAHLE